MTNVKIVAGLRWGEDGRAAITVRVPYDERFRSGARSLGGEWYAGRRVWAFDARRESDVRELCRMVFGTDGDDTPVLVDVRVDLSGICRRIGYRCDEIRLYGRQIAKRWRRDEPVRLGKGVRLLSGGFATRGGSQKYPELAPLYDTVIEVLDVPESLTGGHYAELEVVRRPLDPDEERLARELSEGLRGVLIEAIMGDGRTEDLSRDEKVLVERARALGAERRKTVLARALSLRSPGSRRKE